MEFFNAKYNDGKILILSNTYWHVSINGNFTLSMYSGNGNAELDIIIPSDIRFGIGEVIFSYGESYCIDKPKIKINKENDKYFKVIPNYVCLSGKNSTAIVTVFSNNDFNLKRESNKYYSVLPFDNDKLMIISNTDKDFGCNGDIKILIDDLINPNKAEIKVYQCLNNKSENNCVLYAKYSKINHNTYNINVESLYNGSYSLFTWDEIDNVTITKINANTLNLVFNDVLDDSVKLTLHNKCEDFELIVNKDNDYLTSIFDIAAKCNGVIGRKGGEIELSIVSKSITTNDDYAEIINNNRKISTICDNQ